MANLYSIHGIILVLSINLHFWATCCDTSFYIVVGAVHQYYESRWYLFNDKQPDRVETARNTMKNSNHTTLQKQVIEKIIAHGISMDITLLILNQ